MTTADHIHCLWCDRPFIARNSRHVFCSKECVYCYRRGGTPYVLRGWYWSDEENRIIQPDIENVKTNIKKKEPRIKKVFVYPSKVGYIYLMKSENGLYKIGRALNIENRLKGLNREIPIKVEIIHYYRADDYTGEEIRLHKLYADQRVKYEWFALNDEQVQEIKSLGNC